MAQAAESRAWVYTQRGAPWDVLKLVWRASPTLAARGDDDDDEEWIVVRVGYAALNVGALVQMALLPSLLRRQVESTAEMEFTGVVVQGDDSGRFRAGDGLVAMIPAAHGLGFGTGALAELVALPARYAVAKPACVSQMAAAGVLVAGMTARLLVLHPDAGVVPGGRVLVNAAGGGVGSLAVQMARHVVGPTGRVVAICRAHNASRVRRLGADHVIDYTPHSPAGLGALLARRYGASPFTAVVDAVGVQALYRASPGFLVRHGVYSSVGILPSSLSVLAFLRAIAIMALNYVWPLSPWLGGVGRRWRAVSMMDPSLDDRQRVVDMLAAGHIRVDRDSVWPFECVIEAYQKLAQRHASGKILVKVDAALGDDE